MTILVAVLAFACGSLLDQGNILLFESVGVIGLGVLYVASVIEYEGWKNCL